MFERGSIAHILITTVLATLTLSGLAFAQDVDVPETAATPPPPNIVFIFADDLGYGDIGAFGATDVKTPNIDQIAARGAKFTDFYSASPVCSPSRAALLTGRLPIRMGIHHVFNETSYRGMPESELTIAELLQTRGYATSAIGKWHLGHQPSFLPLNQGFDEFSGIPYSNDMSPLPWLEGNDFVEDTVDQTQITQRITDAAVDFIDRHTGAPFFLYVPHPMPHVPLYTSGPFEGVSARGAYGDVIEELDASVGEIMGALDRNGLTENTLLVFTSDNGPWIFMGDEGGSSGPLRNGKGTTFEGGVRVPTVAMLPNVIDAGLVYQDPASMMDWLPTIAGFTDAVLSETLVLDGVDLSDRLRGSGAVDATLRSFPLYSHGRLEAVRQGDWKLKRSYSTAGNPIPAPIRMFLGGEIGLKDHDALLFNLRDDPSEQKNLAKKHPEKVAELETLMAEFEAEIGEIPPNITPLGLSVSPAIGVVMSAAVKLGLILLALLTIVVAATAFWIGRRTRKTGVG